MGNFLMKWVVVCVLAAVWGVAQADEQAKAPLKFKLMTGEQYPLCRDYVDMLNKTQYTEVPMCERKILPKFGKFKAVGWTEITDKSEIRRITREGIRLHNRNNTLWPNAEEEQWRYAASRMDAGEYSLMYMAKIDMDHDGKHEVVYKSIWERPDSKECTKPRSFVVIEDLEDPVKQYKEKGYWDLWGGAVASYEIFYYDGRTYIDSWLGDTYDFQLELHEIAGINARVCGVNIIQ